MKPKLTLYIIIIILLAFIFGAGFMIFNLNSEIQRLSNNFNQTYANVLNKDLILSKAEFKQINKENSDALLSYIMDSLKIKEKRIYRTVDNNYSYHYDTTIIIKELPNYSDSSFLKTFSYIPDSCIRVDGIYDLLKDSVMLEVYIDYESKTVYYLKRITKKGKKIFWPFGKLRGFAVTENNCKGTTTTEMITVE